MMGTSALPPKLPLGHWSSAWIQSHGRCHPLALQMLVAAWGHPGPPLTRSCPRFSPGKETLRASKRPAHSLLPSGVRVTPGARALAGPLPLPAAGEAEEPACLS